MAECGELPSLGEYHEGIGSVEEAIAIFKEISLERMNGIPNIGFKYIQRERKTMRIPSQTFSPEAPLI